VYVIIHVLVYIVSYNYVKNRPWVHRRLDMVVDWVFKLDP
jgi:hypothetical protein